jgi:uncharacterized protein involved in outer membrane biogenesis
LARRARSRGHREYRRELAIHGEPNGFDWPRLHLRAVDVTFANPPWAQEKHAGAAVADIDVDLPRLFAGTLFLTEVELERSRVSFEVGAEERRNWPSTRPEGRARAGWIDAGREAASP